MKVDVSGPEYTLSKGAEASAASVESLPKAQDSGAATRDRRIDVLRGVAVLGISANHIWPEGVYGTQFSGYKFGHLFAFDFADVFVLLSGIVAGLVFFPLLQHGGLKTCYARSVRRAGQIWGAQILCVLAALPLILVFERMLNVTGSQLSPFEGATLLAGFAGNLLLYQPSIFLDILPVYIMLLLVLPLALMVFQRSFLLYVFLTGALWASVWVPGFLIGTGLLTTRPGFLDVGYFMHPLAAQLLFFTGVAIGIRKPAIEAFIARHRQQVLLVALIFLLISNYMSQVTWMVHHFDQKYFGGPLRMTELLAVLAIFWCLVGPRFNTSKRGVVEACGRHALPVFAITAVGAIFFTYMVIWLEADRLIYGLCIAANVSLCLACGALLEQRRSVRAPGARPGKSNSGTKTRKLPPVQNATAT